MNIDIYVDDLTLTCCGATEKDVIDKISAAARDLAEVIERDLKCKIATHKAATVASTESLATKLRAAIGQNAGKPLRSTPNLGADFNCARGRGRHGRSRIGGLRI